MTNFTDDLNDMQREAVLAVEGPVLILAGAGSGKTKTLVYRIAYLIQNGVRPENILAVTFTNKAAREMVTRVQEVLQTSNFKPQSVDSKYPIPNTQYRIPRVLPQMGTFHSICAKMLRYEAEKIGYSSNFTIYDQGDSMRVIKISLQELGITDKSINPNTIKNYISSAKNELLGPKEYEKLAHGYPQEVASKVYFLYQRYLKENNALDFDDLIFNVVGIFKSHPEILEKYQKLFQYIHIDEYQDTNKAQYAFANMLARKHGNLCVVGDDWQSIYSWRGANFQNILNFERDYPKTKVIKLEQNYRSTKTILDAGHSIIKMNENRSEKELWTDNPKGMPILLYEAGSEEDEGRFIVDEVRRLADTGKELNDFAILYRTNAQSRALEEQFLRTGLKYRIFGGVRFYERKEVKDIIAYLRFIVNMSDMVSLERIINVPTRGIGTVTFNKIKELIRTVSAEDMIKTVVEENALPKKVSGEFEKFWDMVMTLRKEKGKITVSQFVEKVIIKTSYLNFLDDKTIQGEERQENLKELLSVTEEFGERGSNPYDLDGFLEEIALISDTDNYSESAEAVTLMTMHSAKGLEYPVVFVVGMEENIFPHSRTQMDPEEMEEERRLCYVAITRAKEIAYLIYARKRMLYGHIESNLPSRFISDIPAELVSHLSSSVSVSVRDDFEAVAYIPGEKVHHEKFGYGIVVDVGDDEVSVAFEGVGIKHLSASYAPIEKMN